MSTVGSLVGETLRILQRRVLELDAEKDRLIKERDEARKSARQMRDRIEEMIANRYPLPWEEKS